MSDALTPYPAETSEGDDGTMTENVADLEAAVIGHRIVKTEQRFTAETSWLGRQIGWLAITLDNGHEVQLHNTDDCCAYTDLEAFLLHPDKVDHVIMGVGTTDEFTSWHIYADCGDVLELTVGWSAGNPFYYGYGFAIHVVPVPAP